MFDGGIFILILAIGFIFMYLGLRYQPEFKLFGAFAFFVLAVILFGDQDVGFVTNIDDGSTTINQTYYIVGDGNPVTDNAQQRILGWFFMGMGLLMVIWFFTELLSAKGLI